MQQAVTESTDPAGPRSDPTDDRDSHGVLESSGSASIRQSGPRPPSILRHLVTAFSVLAVLLLVATSAFVLTGHRASRILTGSMAPAMPQESLVLTERTTADALRVGDVVLFADPYENGITIVHRVYSITPADGSNLALRTKGDANGAPDAWTLSTAPSAQVDRAIFSIDHGGMLVNDGRRLLITALLVLIVGMGLTLVLRRAPR